MQPLQPNLQVTFTYKDILFRKLYSAIIYSVLSQFLLLNFYLILINGDPFDPLSLVKTFTSPSVWLHLIPHMLIIFAQCLICAKDYVLSTNFSSTRFQKFLSVFSLHNLALLTLHGLVGVVQVWLVLSLGDFKKLLKEGDKHSMLVEETLFLLLGGLWCGLYFFTKVYISDKHLEFPVIQQKKLTLFKSNLVPLLKESFKQAVLPCVYFVTFYYFWGHNLKQYFAFIFNLNTNADFDVRIYLYHYLFASLFFFNMNLIKLFFGLFLTEVVEFPITNQKNILTLQESINLQSLPIIQSLACLDLYLLSMWSPGRRQALFALSQPGEHPHNWNMLIEAILKLYNSYIDILDKSTENICDKTVKNPLIPNVKNFRNLRNMTINLGSPATVQSPVKSTATIEETLSTRLQNRINNFVSLVKEVTGINYFFGEIPEANIQKCLANGNLIVWSSQGLAELICLSIKEDQYGVVHKDLPIVISTLVRLSQVLDKLNQIPALSRRIAGADNFNFKIKNAIAASVKRSLFHICNTFRNYFNEIPLNKETSSYLSSTILVKNVGF